MNIMIINREILELIGKYHWTKSSFIGTPLRRKTSMVSHTTIREEIVVVIAPTRARGRIGKGHFGNGIIGERKSC